MSKIEFAVGDRVQWKNAEFTAAEVVEVRGSSYKVRFETQGPLCGQTMILPGTQLRKMSVLDEMAVEVDPPDPFFRKKDDPDFGKDVDFKPR